MNSGPLTVTARRRYRASREAVFRAFAEPQYVARWFSPSDEVATEVLSFDFRVGGAYRFGFRFPGGERNSVSGQYREISHPGRLVFTWTWDEPDPHAGVATLVTVDLLARGEETEVVVTHTNFPNCEIRDRHEHGWNGALDRLARLTMTP